MVYTPQALGEFNRIADAPASLSRRNSARHFKRMEMQHSPVQVRPASQSGLHRLTYEGRSKSCGHRGISRYDSVSVCGTGHGSVHFGSLSFWKNRAYFGTPTCSNISTQTIRTNGPSISLTAPWRTAAERAALSSPRHHREAALPKRPEQAAWRRRGPAACPAEPPRAFRPSPG